LATTTKPSAPVTTEFPTSHFLFSS